VRRRGHREVSGEDFTASCDGPVVGRLAGSSADCAASWSTELVGKCSHNEVSGEDFTASWTAPPSGTSGTCAALLGSRGSVATARSVVGISLPRGMAPSLVRLKGGAATARSVW